MDHDDAALVDKNSSGKPDSGNNSATTFPRQQVQRAGQVRRSSLINASADAQAAQCSYSGASNATPTFQVSSQATLSRPNTSSLQSLLGANRPRTPSASSENISVLSATRDAYNARLRRHTLAGGYQILLTTVAGGASSHISGGATPAASNGNASEAARLSRIRLIPTTSATLFTSNHTPVPVAPVPPGPSHSRLQSTRTLAPDQLPESPHISQRILLHATHSDSQVPSTEHELYTAGESAVSHHPSSPIEIPQPPRDTSHSLAPLTARPREGLPPIKDQLTETPRRRPALLPYYAHNVTTVNSRPPSLKSCASSASLSSRSSTADLPTGALSPLSTRSKKDDHCTKDDHRRCPSSPSKHRPGRRSSRRQSPSHYGQHLKPDRTQMRASTTSGFSYTPTSPLSPGLPRNITATMQQNKNANTRSRKLQPEFSLPIPRFHPAVYQSPSASNASTAASSPRNGRTPGGLHPPTSPRALQRHNDQARTALMETYQEMIRTSGAAGTAPTIQQLPDRPALAPARSPGEATPLTLEDGPGDYLTAGAARRGQHAANQREMIERMIRDEEERRKGSSSIPSSAPVSPAGGA